MAKQAKQNSLASIPGTLVLVGAGKMGGAMLEGWLARKLPPRKVVVLEPQPSKQIKALAKRGVRINPKGAIDWRQDAGQGLVKVEPIATPPDVEKGILEFARKSGIAYGSFDFGVDAQGQWWFLEVNEGGQFLWLDDNNRSLHIQEKFLAFLTAPEGASREEIERRQSQFPSWQDYLDSPAKDQVPAEEPDPEAAFMSKEP